MKNKTSTSKGIANVLVNRRHFGTTLENKLKDDFNKLAERTRIPKSRLMDEAVRLLLEKHEHIV